MGYKKIKKIQPIKIRIQKRKQIEFKRALQAEIGHFQEDITNGEGRE